nr:MAG TPA: hypothetical protein [Caudoviricetes sp.]
MVINCRAATRTALICLRTCILAPRLSKYYSE